ncbi:MAG: o-succinylbenzoate synthase [Candidatus Woesearchaeota archaeon]
MYIDKIEMYHLSIPLKESFQTSNEVKDHIEHIIIKVFSKNSIGYGECTCNQTPYYIDETTETAWHILKKFIIPYIKGIEINRIEDLLNNNKFKAIKGNNFAKAGIELAIWDLLAKKNNKSLSNMLGGKKEYIETGVSIGIQKDESELIDKVENCIKKGYKRIKLKIKPGHDYKYLKLLRNKYPNLPLMADANSAYTLSDIKLFKQLDDLNLLMIEQPLDYDDIIDHAKLQKQINTPICLDESIHSINDARKAIEFDSCKVINIKVGRVGGLYESLKIHNYCLKKGIPVWCGGMHEYGIGRAHNIAINSLENFAFPGDISASEKYYKKDIINPSIKVKNGYIKVPTNAGIGVNPDMNEIERYTIKKSVFK